MTWDDDPTALGVPPWAPDRAVLIAAARQGAATLGAWYRDRRRRRGWTQTELAWRSRTSQSAISRLETGRLRGIRLTRLALIVAALDGVAIPTLGDHPDRRRRRVRR